MNTSPILQVQHSQLAHDSIWLNVINIIMKSRKNFFLLLYGQSGGACWCRVCFQRGLPHLVITLGQIESCANCECLTSKMGLVFILLGL